MYEIDADVGRYQVMITEGGLAVADRIRTAIAECPVRGPWDPPFMRRAVDEPHRPIGDCVDVSGALVVTRRAVEVLEPLLVGCEILDVRCKDEQLAVINVPVRDLLDLSRSVCRLSASGKLQDYTTAEFRECSADDSMLFRPYYHAGVSRSMYFCNDVFREAVGRAGLNGFKFRDTAKPYDPWDSIIQGN